MQQNIKAVQSPSHSPFTIGSLNESKHEMEEVIDEKEDTINLSIIPNLKDESIYSRIKRLEAFLENKNYKDSDSESSDSSTTTKDSPAVNLTYTEDLQEKLTEELRETAENETSDEAEKTIIYYDEQYNSNLTNTFNDIVNQTIKEVSQTDCATHTDPDFDEFDQMVLEFDAPKTTTPTQTDDDVVVIIDEEPIPIATVQSRNPTPKKDKIIERFTRAYNGFIAKTPTLAFEVRTRDVTPPPDYNSMNDIKLEWEMKKYGLKYIKKKEDRIKILNYIYTTTHPSVEVQQDDQNISLCLITNNNPAVSPIKTKHRNQSMSQPNTASHTITNATELTECQLLEIKYGLAPSQPLPSRRVISPKKRQEKRPAPVPSIKLDDFFDVESSSMQMLVADFLTTNLMKTPDDDLLFLPVKPKGKFQWCPLPLHIAFGNLLRVNDFFKWKILRYEPFEIEVIYKYFKLMGARYELSDLKAFFDRKCITFRSEN